MSLQTSADLSPDLYQSKSTIETPALAVDIQQMKENILEFKQLADRRDVALSSHTKVHKTPDIAHLQRKLTGCEEILCQTTSEAEVMAKNGIREIRISNQIVGERKLNRLAWLSTKLDSLVTAVDGPGNIRPLQRMAERHDITINVDIEVDTGLNRAGTKPGEPTVDIAETIEDMTNLRLKGLLTHDAHLPGQAESEEELEELCMQTMAEIEDTVKLIESKGIRVDDIVSGSTRTAPYIAKHPVVTHIDPGRYIFNDELTLATKNRSDCALTILTTVGSKPTDDRVIVDAGYKTIGGRSQLPTPKSEDDLRYYNASAEHGHIDTSDYPQTIRVGDRLEMIPHNSHAAVGANHILIGIENDRVEDIWDIQGRGKTK